MNLHYYADGHFTFADRSPINRNVVYTEQCGKETYHPIKKGKAQLGFCGDTRYFATKGQIHENGISEAVAKDFKDVIIKKK